LKVLVKEVARQLIDIFNQVHALREQDLHNDNNFVRLSDALTHIRKAIDLIKELISQKRDICKTGGTTSGKTRDE